MALGLVRTFAAPQTQRSFNEGAETPALATPAFAASSSPLTSQAALVDAKHAILERIDLKSTRGRRPSSTGWSRSSSVEADGGGGQVRPPTLDNRR
eukprot:4675217-Prymnesium_polylepis.1